MGGAYQVLSTDLLSMIFPYGIKGKLLTEMRQICGWTDGFLHNLSHILHNTCTKFLED